MFQGEQSKTASADLVRPPGHQPGRWQTGTVVWNPDKKEFLIKKRNGIRETVGYDIATGIGHVLASNEVSTCGA
jgi:hypothetical protein